MTITEFLLARIAEDEAAAQDAFYDGQQWIPEEEAVVAADHDLEPILYFDRKRDAIHAAKWSPARVLAECAAKRAIIGMHQRDGDVQRMIYGDIYPCTECGDVDDAPVEWPCRTLRALAAVYADHPDYLPEWAL